MAIFLLRYAVPYQIFLAIVSFNYIINNKKLMTEQLTKLTDDSSLSKLNIE